MSDKIRKAQEVAFKTILPVLQVQYPGSAIHHVSGGFPKPGSDVDILVVPAADQPEEFRSSQQVRGLDVNVLVSKDPSRLRAKAHRAVELELAAMPNVAARVQALREQGVKTEPAVAQVLGQAPDVDPYDYVAAMEDPAHPGWSIAKTL